MNDISLLKCMKLIMSLLLVMMLAFATHDIYSSHQGYEQTMFAEKTKIERDDIDEINYNIATIRGIYGEQVLNIISNEPLNELTIKQAKNLLASSRGLLASFISSTETNDAYSAITAELQRDILYILSFYDNGLKEITSGKFKSENDVGKTLYVIGNNVKKYHEINTRIYNNVLESAEHVKMHSSVIAIVLLSLYLLITLFAGAWFNKNIILKIKLACDIFDKISKGDFSSRIEFKSKNEIGFLFSRLEDMQASLQQIIHSVKESVVIISHGSTEIADANFSLSTRTDQQASALQDTAASMEQIKTTVASNAQNAQQANQLSYTASLAAKKGAEVMSSVVTTMSGIEESAQKIAEITSVINSIASQSNILALNAAVEAARAGELGRGFAVVAAEVRNLASRSGNSAKEIHQLINEAVRNISHGSELVTNAGESMNDIVSSITLVSNIMEEISVASEEQSAGINLISDAINQIDTMTNQNTLLVEESAQNTRTLSNQAKELSDTVAMFQVDNNKSD